MYNPRINSVGAYLSATAIGLVALVNFGCGDSGTKLDTSVRGVVRGAIVEKSTGKDAHVLVVKPYEGSEIGKPSEKIQLVVPHRVSGVFRPVIENKCLETEYTVLTTTCDLEGQVNGKDSTGRYHLSKVIIMQYSALERKAYWLEQAKKYGKEAVEKGGELIERGADWTKKKAQELKEKAK